MAGWMERHRYAIYCSSFAPVEGRNRSRDAEARAQNRRTVVRAEIFARAPRSVIAVSVGDERSLYREPRVYVELAGFAVESPISYAEEVRWWHEKYALDLHSLNRLTLGVITTIVTRRI